MRSIPRSKLPKEAADFLRKRKRAARPGIPSEKAWKTARASAKMKPVVRTLQQMTGNRQRCTYCLDSNGSDVEHFWPKARYPKKMFMWKNLLLCCTECGRLKGDQFPMQARKPLLIDPTREQPWNHLGFDPVTGIISARYDPSASSFDRKGSKTTDVLQLNKREALSEGHRRTWRRLKEIVDGYLDNGQPSAKDLPGTLHEADEYGLLGWCFQGAGHGESPFAELRKRNAGLWKDCAEAVRRP